MKTTAFKVFASFVAIVYLASSPVSRASPLLKSDSATSENPIVMKKYPGVRQIKNLVGQNVMNLKTYYSMSIMKEVVQRPAVYEHMVSQTLDRQRRFYNPEVEQRLGKEQGGDGSSSCIGSKEVIPKPPGLSNESHQLNENQNSEQSNEVQNSEQSDEVQNSEQSDSAQNSEQSDSAQKSQESNEDPGPFPKIIPSSESLDIEEYSHSGENKGIDGKKKN